VNNMTTPAAAAQGDMIEHDLMHGYQMPVVDLMACETSPARPLEHSQFLILDPEGNEDWLCAYDVHRVD